MTTAQITSQRLPEYVDPKSEGDALQKIGQLAHTIHEHAYLLGRFLIWLKANGKREGMFEFYWKGDQINLFSYRTGRNLMFFARKCDKAGELLEYHPGQPTQKRKLATVASEKPSNGRVSLDTPTPPEQDEEEDPKWQELGGWLHSPPARGKAAIPYRAISQVHLTVEGFEEVVEEHGKHLKSDHVVALTKIQARVTQVLQDCEAQVNPAPAGRVMSDSTTRRRRKQAEENLNRVNDDLRLLLPVAEEIRDSAAPLDATLMFYRSRLFITKELVDGFLEKTGGIDKEADADEEQPTD